jgi:hypothetical protein
MHGDSGKRRWAIALLVLLAAAAIGAVAYQVGVSHGLALRPPVVAAPPAAGGPAAIPGPYVYPAYPYGYYRPWRFGFFGPFLFVLFWFVIFRGMFRMGGGWPRWHHGDPDYWPGRFDEWHRRAHERMQRDATPPSAAS